MEGTSLRDLLRNLYRTVLVVWIAAMAIVVPSRHAPMGAEAMPWVLGFGVALLVASAALAWWGWPRALERYIVRRAHPARQPSGRDRLTIDLLVVLSLVPGAVIVAHRDHLPLEAQYALVILAAVFAAAAGALIRATEHRDVRELMQLWRTEHPEVERALAAGLRGTRRLGLRMMRASWNALARSGVGTRYELRERA